MTNLQNTGIEYKEIKVQSRWKSVYVWTALATQILSILVLTGAIEVSQSDVVTQVVAMVLQIGVIVGVLNNPSDKKEW